MFFQPPDPEQQPTKSIQNNPRRRRKKKAKRNKRICKKDHSKRKHSFHTTMSSWAETFTTAATWQLKHQVAYWKSKATMLSYENQILHDIIRKNYLNTGTNNHENVQNFDNNDTVKSDLESSEDESSDSEGEVEQQNEDFEVSEEFIQFLRENAKYKEDARRERELLKARLNEEQKPMELDQVTEESNQFSEAKLKELYGKDWRRISALEMSVKCDFMSGCDREKPLYWPNIPFNFN